MLQECEAKRRKVIVDNKLMMGAQRLLVNHVFISPAEGAEQRMVEYVETPLVASSAYVQSYRELMHILSKATGRAQEQVAQRLVSIDHDMREASMERLLQVWKAKLEPKKPTTTNWFDLLPASNQEATIDDCCSICLADLEFGATAVTPCAHKFHPECLMTMVQTSVSTRGHRCPNCRSVFHPWQDFTRLKRTETAVTATTEDLDEVKHPDTDEMVRRNTKALWLYENVTSRLHMFKGDKIVVLTKSPFVAWSVLPTNVRATSRWVSSARGLPHMQRAVEAFTQAQCDPSSTMLLFLTPHLGTVGLNLTVANHVWFLDVPETITALNQGVGRVNRHGQLKAIRVETPYLLHTHEKKLLERRQTDRMSVAERQKMYSSVAYV
jgi:hypothetical protein